jgi:hypothetical protein
MPLGTIGRIVSGPVEADGFVWWDINYDVGIGEVRGWSAENWLEFHVNEAPTCVVELQQDGVEISEVGVWGFFDIYVGDSTGDTGIKQVRFSSDNVQDGYPTGEWTDWFDWDISSEDWNATTKIKRWAFDTPGYKEVWAEVKDEADHTAVDLAKIFVPAPALPVLISPLFISPVKDTYTVGDSLTAEFTLENIGETQITLDKLTVGGRVNGWIETDGYPDFTYRQVTLQPGVPYQYSESLTFTKPGNYRFFIAYNIENPSPEEKKLLDENNWNTCIELGEGLTQTARVKIVIVYEEGTLPGEPEALRVMISRLTRLNPHAPPYLLGVDSWKESVATLWAGFTSWATQTDLTEKYDELYYAGLNYYGLRSKALHDADSALDRRDIEYAKKCVERSRTYDKLAYMSFTAASEVFDGNLEAGEILAQGIRTGCETAVKFGVKVIFPAAGIAADGIYLVMNFGLNTWIEGVDKATVDMAVDAAFIIIFQQIRFPSIGGNTLETYVNGVSQNMPLTELLKNGEFMQEFGFELENVLAQRVLVQYGITLSEWQLKEMVKAIVQRFASMGDSQQTGTECPVELRVQDAEGRVTGIISGRVRQEIPVSLCYNGTVQIFFSSDPYSYAIVGTDIGTYELIAALTKEGNATVFNATDIPTSPNTIHQYTVDWDALSLSEEGVTVLVDADGDGVIDRIFSSDSELTGEEFLEKTSPTYPTYALTIIASESGTTFPPLGTYACSVNSTVQVTAFPDEGYVLDYWELDSINVGSDNTYTVLMDADHVLNAVFRPGIYNIAITNVSPSKTVVAQDYSLNINVVVANQGDFTETFNVTAYANTTAIQTETLTLTSQSFTTLTLTWNTTGFAKGNYTISAYAWPVPGETNTADNNLTSGWILMTILGDVNGDFKCEGKDIALIAKAYGSLVGQAAYVPNADINDDGKIDGKDIAVAAKYYGTRYP